MKINLEFDKNEIHLANCAINVDRLLYFIINTKRWIEAHKKTQYDLAYEVRDGMKIVKDETAEKIHKELESIHDMYFRGIEFTGLEDEIHYFYNEEFED